MSEADSPVADNVYLAFVKTARRHSHRPALRADGGRGRTYTYDELGQEVRRLAFGLGTGASESQREIGLLSENRPEWGLAYLAVLAAGKTVVPIDANLKPNEIAHIIEHSGLKVILCSERFEPVLAGLSSECSVYSFAEESDNSWKALFMENGELAPASGDSVAALIYTSGTTGSPKAVELTHTNILANIQGCQKALVLFPDDVMLSVLPLHHTLEATGGFLLPLMSGMSVVYARSLKSRDLLQDVATNGVTILIGVPLLFEKIYHTIRRKLKEASRTRRVLFSSFYVISYVSGRLGIPAGRKMFSAIRQRAGLGSIRVFVSGAAAIPMEIVKFFNIMGLTLLQGYGLTECSPVVSLSRQDDNIFGSVGPPLDNVEVRIDRPGEDMVGEIVVRGPSITRGYRNNPEETAVLIRDGWLYTGDLGKFDRGHLWITGRQKTVIVSAAGKNIYPEELEERLLTSLYVMEALVFGRKKEGKQGEEVRALVVPDLQQFESEFGLSAASPDMGTIREQIQQVINEVNHQVADFKRITGFEVQLDELEKTSTKKVKRYLYS